jgi:uncharacterized protein YkwD
MKLLRPLLAAVLISSAFVLSNSAYADALNVINTLRVKDCAKPLAQKQRLMRNAKLAAAARYVDDGIALRDALKRAGYRADQSAVLHFGGTIDDAVLKRMLAKDHCATLTDAGLVDVGIFTTSRSIAMVFAAPFAPPSPTDAPHVARQVLALVNEARAKPRRCGKEQFKSAAPVTLNERLLGAATAHAKDMAKRGVVSHEGADGSSPGDRATRAGYAWKSVGENVAAGQLSAEEVVAGWLSSPGHCVNIMDADYTQMAVAYVVNSKQEMGIYWAQVFGRPQEAKRPR